MSDQQAIIEANNVSKTYYDAQRPVDVLTSINLKILPGERVAIIGPSGSGKSTLLHLLGGLDSVSEGNIKVDGYDLSQLTENQRSQLRNKSLGFVYQFHHLLPEFTALENVAMPLLINGNSKQDARDRATDMLNHVGLGERLEHKSAQMSGGERQRTAIARALVTNPHCLFADEPTGNLDTDTAEHVYETMLNLNQVLNTSLLIVTHDQQLAQRMDRILVISHGQLREQQ